ncbi:KPN_02809 family neutral zinc metallopeptidase [Desulfofustis limnaeus]|uniref:Membrane protein n=1 Tax=Desulfofustis limnaeus TaxID=2740163 RepID=A0ABN6MB21_9BACT|nr:neutral zinc metallopeptidase [Desulfofustis limnaeus]MDX9895042.1 neutral zinc metallopeptidase [Desulfofustis sp.]BDD89229.1 membrane protein [Desulfofustis limnaeus]
MRWRDGRRSSNVEDRRNVRLSGKMKGGGIGILILALIGMYFGIDPRIILEQGAQLSGGPTVEQAEYQPTAAENELADFVSVVLADTEDTWSAIFSQTAGGYQKPTLVLFSGAVQSACGFAQAATGPFYCPADRKVYIDLSFYQDLRNKLGAPGDFAQAYVIAHEVGHHVQNLLGISDQLHDLRGRVSQTEYNRLMVKLELQADCFAGLWANHADRSRQILESGDIEEALNAASMIGDDRLQQQSRGYVTPDSFTHGTSDQRTRWFRRGFQSGRVDSCDTFSAQDL